MRYVAKGWLVIGLLLSTMAYAIAEDITLTTYYPSPRGVYEQIITTGQTQLATQSSGVMIGTTGTPSYTLHVSGSGTLGITRSGQTGEVKVAYSNGGWYAVYAP